MTGFQVETMKSGNPIPCECMANQRSECRTNFHWRPYSKSFLKTFVIVKMDVLLNGRTQLALNSLLQLAFSRSFHERGLALFLVFPYLAKKTPFG